MGAEVEFAQKMSAVLSLSAMALTVAVIAAFAVSRLGARGSARLERVRDLIRRSALWMIFAVSATATAGSLYFSERVGYAPCEFCWFQRIAMYPLAALSLVAALRRDRSSWPYLVVLASGGLAVSLWHSLIEKVPSLSGSSSCSVTVPCTVPWFVEFGFMTLATMAASGFLAVLVLASALRTKD
jgi:disulfide bond formation protein DsbB